MKVTKTFHIQHMKTCWRENLPGWTLAQIVNLEIRKKYAEKVENFRISLKNGMSLFRNENGLEWTYLGMKMFKDKLISETTK